MDFWISSSLFLAHIIEKNGVTEPLFVRICKSVNAVYLNQQNERIVEDDIVVSGGLFN